MRKATAIFKRICAVICAVAIPAAAFGCACGPAAPGSSTPSVPSAIIIPPSSTASPGEPVFPAEPSASVTLPYQDPAITAGLGFTGYAFHYEQLGSERQRALYKAYIEALVDCALRTQKVSGEFSEAEVREVIDAANNDYPQFFANLNSYGVTFYYDNADRVEAVSCAISYIFVSKEAVLARREGFYARINAVLAEAAKISDPLDRQVFIYETVAESAKYDYDEAEKVGTNLLAHTAYGCLMEGITVCDGYAHAFSLLCNYSGIRATSVVGYMGGYNHAWSAVEYGGKLYFSDITADDDEGVYLDENGNRVQNPESAAGLVRLPDNVSHKFFNLTYAEMAQDHSFISASLFREKSAADRTGFTWHERQGAFYADAARMKEALGARLRLCGRGDIIEFGVSFDGGAAMTALEQLFESLKLPFSVYVTHNAAQTGYALYIQ